jgi:drug/metabolite transporter (DMT)-like permease
VTLGVIGVFGFNVLFFLGMRYTSPVNASLIVGTNPLITVILSSLALGETLRAMQKAGLALSVLGVVLVITGGSWAVIRDMSISVGDVLMLAACTCWAVYSVLVRRHLSESSPLATTAITIVFGSLAMIPFALMEHRPTPLSDVPPSVWIALLYMGVPGAVLAYLFWNRAVKQLGPARASLYYNLLPVFTMAISIALGDAVAPAQVAGGAIVIGGCLLSQIRAIESPRIDAATRSHARAD